MSAVDVKELQTIPRKYHRWEYPTAPWQRLHIDFAGPFQGCMLLVVVDASTKWPEIMFIKNTTTEETGDPCALY